MEFRPSAGSPSRNAKSGNWVSSIRKLLTDIIRKLAAEGNQISDEEKRELVNLLERLDTFEQYAL